MKRNKIITFIILFLCLSFAGQEAHAAENCRYGCYPKCPTGTNPISGECNAGFVCCYDQATNNASPTNPNPATLNSSNNNASGTSGNFYVNQEKIPGAAQQTGDIAQYIKDIVNFGFAVIGILTMFMLMIGAYQYLMAAGNIAKVDHAKTTISSALLGLIIGICAWVLLRTINPDLVNPSLQVIQGIGGTSGTSGGTALTSDMSKVKCDTVRNYTGFMNKNSSELFNENIKSAQDLRIALEKFRKGPTNGLTKYADTIYQACQTSHVPYWYAIGTFAHESNMFFEYKNEKDGEKYGCSYYNNPGCILNPKTGKPKQYANEEAGIRENIALMGSLIAKNPTPLGAWNAWYWPDRSEKNCAGAQSYLSKYEQAAKATGLSGV